MPLKALTVRTFSPLSGLAIELFGRAILDRAPQVSIFFSEFRESYQKLKSIESALLARVNGRQEARDRGTFAANQALGRVVMNFLPNLFASPVSGGCPYVDESTGLLNRIGDARRRPGRCMSGRMSANHLFLGPRTGISIDSGSTF
jgi:hypothetical protein